MWREYVDEALTACRQSLGSVESMVDELRHARVAHAPVFIAGNGGSEANADHFAQDLLSAGLVATNLGSSNARLTAYANDWGYDQAYSEMLVRLCDRKSLVVAVTTSGNSRNLTRLAAEAKRRSTKVVALSGRDGGELKYFADVEIRVPSWDPGVIESVHLLVMHYCIRMLSIGD